MEKSIKTVECASCGEPFKIPKQLYDRLMKARQELEDIRDEIDVYHDVESALEKTTKTHTAMKGLGETREGKMNLWKV
jgi:DNA replication initiation complex subunit (GINS family)